MRKTATRIAEIALFLLTAFISFYCLSFTPYYVGWDMDLITGMDLLEIQNGNLPLHIHHTGLGMYFFGYIMLKLSGIFNLLSAYTYTDIINSWNIIFPTAEFTYWLKSLNFLIVNGVFVFSYLGAKNFLKEKGHLVSILALLAIISTSSIWNFQLYVIRSELYSIFFFSVAFYYLSLKESFQKRSLLILGFLMGVAFLTKYQGFFILCTFIVMTSWDKESKFVEVSKKWKFGLILTFLLVTVFSRLTYLPSFFAEFAEFYRPNLFFIVVTTVTLISLLIHQKGKTIGKIVIQPWFISMSNKWVLLVTGLLFSFGLCFLFFSDMRLGFEYFLFLWRMIFLKIARDYSYANPHSDKLSFLVWTLKYFSFLFIALGMAFLTTKKTIKSTILLLLGVVSLLVAHRGSDQDALWNEFLLIWIFFYFAKNLNYRWIACGLILVIIGNVKNYDSKGFLNNKPIGILKIYSFLKEPYENPYMPYTETIEKKYSEDLKVQSLLVARDHNRLRFEQGILWKEPKLNLKSINIIQAGSRVGQDVYIKSFSESLKNKLISGFDKGYQDITIRNQLTGEAYLATNNQLPSSSRCILTPTNLEIETSRNVVLKVLRITHKDFSPYAGLLECNFKIDQSKSFYIIQG